MSFFNAHLKGSSAIRSAELKSFLTRAVAVFFIARFLTGFSIVKTTEIFNALLAILLTEDLVTNLIRLEIFP